MATIAVVNLKGGVGKSTIAVNLACELAGKDPAAAVLVDADAQGTSGYWCRQGKIPVACEALPLDGPRDAARWIQRVMGFQARYVVIDCPPHIGAAAEAAVGIADLAVIPVTASSADLMATTSALELVKAARQSRGGPACLLVPSKIDRRTGAGREIEAALEQFSERIGPAVHQRAAFVDALSAGEWIGEYAPTSPAHEDIEALARAVRKTLAAGTAA